MLKEPILKLLSQTYSPTALIERKFHRYDLVFKTDDQGRPILLFLGEKQANGKISGLRYVRRLVQDESGKVVKDHWDCKGKATANF